MEDCYNYNRIIEAIEDNIHEEDGKIYELAANAAGLSRREAALIVKSVEGEDYNMYIKRRKIIRCAQHKILNSDEAWQDIAGEFAIFEYSTFHRRFKAFLGVTPEDFPKTFKGDVMKMKPSYIGKENVIVKTETLIKKETETVVVKEDEGTEKANPEIRKFLNDAFSIITPPFSTAAERNDWVKKQVSMDANAKSLLDMYSTIMDLEEIRAVYGLSFEDVLYLYMKNNQDSSTLYERCEQICDERIEEIYSRRYATANYWEEREEMEYELQNNELSVSEAYSYYQGEDEMEYDYEDGYDNNDIKHMYW